MDLKMTFGDLDQMINYWAEDLEGNQCTFLNQIHEVNNIFWRIHSNNQKFQEIQIRLGILHYNHIKLENDLLNASVLEEHLEQMVVKLEQQLMVFEGRERIDSEREIFGCFANVNNILDNYKEESESLLKDIKSIEKENKKNPIENIAQIMMTLLQNLEHIEMKTEQIKNRMRWIDEEIKSILCGKFHPN